MLWEKRGDNCVKVLNEYRNNIRIPEKTQNDKHLMSVVMIVWKLINFSLSVLGYKSTKQDISNHNPNQTLSKYNKEYQIKL